jgi:uncharacterized protein (DUF362 family)
MTQIAFVKTHDRAAGIEEALDLLGFGDLDDQRVFLKPNFNSADPFPGSTHNDTLVALIRELQARDAGAIIVGDRSGMGHTRRVMEQKGIFALAKELGVRTLVFDDLDADGWEIINLPGSHWKRGFAVPRPVLDADVFIQTCCLKTHRFGGHFTLSLKNTIGLVAERVPGQRHNYMRELHGSPHQRLMIAEANAPYQPDLVVMDGLSAFTEGGPARGKQVEPGVILAGTDRVAIDAVGVAILRHYGTTPAVSRGPIFEQEQLARAIELELGVDDPEEIEFVTPDATSQAFAAEITGILTRR